MAGATVSDHVACVQSLRVQRQYNNTRRIDLRVFQKLM
jgi:hypothetical protein